MKATLWGSRFADIDKSAATACKEKQTVARRAVQECARGGTASGPNH
jgi:hypothetical protein